MQLLYSPASPFARKVLILAHELGIADRIELVAASSSPVSPGAEVTALNPLSRIPTLVTDDGLALYDSPVICEYLDHLAGGGMIPAEPARRWPVLRMQALADGLLDSALLARYEGLLRPEALRWPAWVEGHQGKIDRALDELEREVPGLAGRIDLGTIAVAAALGYLDFRFPDRPWREGRPALAAFAAAMDERPSLAATRPG